MSTDFDRFTEPGAKREPIALNPFTPRLVLGFGILVFGVLLLLDNLDLIEASHLIRYLIPSVLLGIGVVAEIPHRITVKEISITTTPTSPLPIS